MFSELAISIREAAAEDFWIITALLLGATLLGLAIWFRSLKRARIIEDTPTSKCRSAAQGYVELIGTQKPMPGDPILAPLTGRRCTWWSFSIEEKRRTYSNGRSRTRWVTVEKGTSESLFLVEDETGEAVIDPDGAEVTPSATDRWNGSSARPTAPPGSSRFFGGRYRYTERRMHTGDDLYAIGLFETHSAHHEPMQRERETAAVLSEWKRDQAGLLGRFDTDGDGRIDMAEWEAARQAARAVVEEQICKAALDPGIHILRQPADGRPFILSVLPETALTRRFRIIAMAGLVLFLAAGAASAFAITTRLAS